MGRGEDSAKYLLWNDLMNCIVLSAYLLPLPLGGSELGSMGRTFSNENTYCYDEKT